MQFSKHKNKKDHLQIVQTQMIRRIARRLSRVCDICYVKDILGNSGNIKSYINQVIFHFISACLTLKGSLRADNGFR